MWTWLAKLKDEALKDVAAFLRQHIFRSIGTTVAFTILLTLALLNPWFGSTTAKAWLIEFMINDSDELSQVFAKLRRDPDYSKRLEPGMREAGYFQFDDTRLVDNWGENWKPHHEAASEEEIRNDRVAAIKTARDRARLGEAPFMPSGERVIAGRPACAEHRPPGGTVFIDDQLLVRMRGLNAHDKVRIERMDRPGAFIVASILSKPIGDPDIWLNQSQLLALDAVKSRNDVRIVKIADDAEISPDDAGTREDFQGCYP